MQGSDDLQPLTERQDGLVVVLAAMFVLMVCLSVPAVAQINGTWPSVTSIPASHFLPNPSPSVTSLGPFGYGRGIPSNLGSAPDVQKFPFRQFPYNRQFGHGRGYGGGYGAYGGYGYSLPYYVPYDASGNGYDYVAGSDAYAGPPGAPSEPVLHIVVEQAPPQPPQAYQNHVTADNNPPNPVRRRDEEAAAAAAESKPRDPTVLVFRDGRKQEISNYAIMGQTVYILDDHTKKIPLADLDVNATVKANDDRGQEFKVPPSTPVKKKDSSVPRQSTPAATPEKPRDIAAANTP